MKTIALKRPECRRAVVVFDGIFGLGKLRLGLRGQGQPCHRRRHQNLPGAMLHGDWVVPVGAPVCRVSTLAV